KKKKIRDVKEYTIPVNPKTDDQKKQRNYLKEAVLAWQTDGYTKLDIEAWKVYASTQKKILSGYNVFLRERINTAKEDKTWTPLTDGKVFDFGDTWAYPEIKIIDDKLGKLYIGTSKVAMYKEYDSVYYPGFYSFSLWDLIPGTKYYCYIKNTAVGVPIVISTNFVQVSSAINEFTLSLT
ncbi:unnamed protein product, partial [marine sediment metagenome]